MGIKPVGANVDEDAVPENSMPTLADDGKRLAAVQKQEQPGVGGPTSTSSKLLAAGDGSEALEDVRKEIPKQSTETHNFVEGTKVMFKGLTELQYNGQVGKILENRTTASTHDRIPVALISTRPARARSQVLLALGFASESDVCWS